MRQYDTLWLLEIFTNRGQWVSAEQMYWVQVQYNYIDGHPINEKRHKNRINTELRRLYKRQYARRARNERGAWAYYISEKGRKYKDYILFNRSLKEQLRGARKRIKELETDKKWWMWVAMMSSDENKELSKENEDLSRALTGMTAICGRAIELVRRG